VLFKRHFNFPEAGKITGNFTFLKSEWAFAAFSENQDE
jgi:hypothetical protein